jgi:hypothetical protein
MNRLQSAELSFAGRIYDEAKMMQVEKANRWMAGA